MCVIVYFYVFRGEKTGKQPFISSDAESISELESDLNDMMENTSSKPGTLLQTKPHTTRTTAELIASVAKLRQNTGQVNATQTIVKSNLKSSLSTGNIMKKKVVFRDEKDGECRINLPWYIYKNLPAMFIDFILRCFIF